MFIENEFDLKQLVYLITDKDQLPRLVTAIKVSSNGVMYELSQGSGSSYHYGFEMSVDVDVLLSTTN